MPKLKATGLPSDEPEMTEGFSNYDGPMPPKGTYHGVLKLCRVKENSKGDQMLSILVEVDETGDKKKYNGFGAWGNINLTESGAPFARRFAESIGAKYRDFQNMLVDNEDPPNLVKLGSVKMDGDLEVVFTLRPNFYQGEERRQIGIFLPVANDDDGDVDGDDDGEEDPF